MVLVKSVFKYQGMYNQLNWVLILLSIRDGLYSDLVSKTWVIFLNTQQILLKILSPIRTPRPSGSPSGPMRHNLSQTDSYSNTKNIPDSQTKSKVSPLPRNQDLLCEITVKEVQVSPLKILMI